MSGTAGTRQPLITSPPHRLVRATSGRFSHLKECIRHVVRCREDMESQDSGAPGLHGIHVLVIEDSSGTLDMLTALLRLEGAVAVGVANGRDALLALRAHDFDVVMSVLGLPVNTGDVLYRTLLDLLPRLS